VADAVVFVAFLAVPLAVWPAFWDQYVTVKWYVLEVLAACWLLAEAWAGSGGWPRFVRENVALVLPAGALGLFSVLRSGPGAALAPLVERTAVLALALCAYWWLRRRQESLAPARAASALALAVVTAVGVAQALGRDPLAALNAGDGRGSTFGNANMAAQYAALALLLLLLDRPWPRPRWRRAGEALVAATAAAWLLLLGTRSVILALGAGLAAPLLLARRTAPRKAVAVAGVAAVVALAWLAAARFLDEDRHGRKAASAEHRLHVWSDTVRLVADHPLGVGAGRFEDAYRPYQATGRGFADEMQVYRHPHSEYLRVAAEEGLPLLLLVGALLVRLAVRVTQGARQRERPGLPLVAAGGAFLAVEATFQFPLALAFPALAAALLLGLALWHAEGAPEPPAAPSRPAAWRAATVLAALFLLWGSVRMARSEWLFVNARQDVDAQERACRLDPRNLPACVQGAWLRGATDLPGARAGLARVLRRAPHYPPAMKLLAQQALAAGDLQAACLYLTAYDTLFRGQSSLHGELAARCDENARRAAAARVPSPHYDRFPLTGADAR
jgi:O-antigen ligase